MSQPAYVWRQLTPQQRDNLMVWRKRHGLPWHRAPHRASEKTRYHITSACFEHRHYIGQGEERMRSFCETLLGVFKEKKALIHAWCVLPNHYHALIEVTGSEPPKGGTPNTSSVSTLQRVPERPKGGAPNGGTPNPNGILKVLADLGRMHGRLSFQWNGEEQTRGRQVWCGAAERYMRNDAHFWATMNYVHHNAVHHGYVKQWLDWPFSSAEQYLAQMGREFAERTWREYPVLDYGKGWDDEEL